MPAVRRRGAVNEPLRLLPGPVPRPDPRCSAHQMTEGLLDQRDFWIIAAAVEQAFQSEQPDFRRELRLLGGEVPRGAHEGRRLGCVVPRAYECDVEEPGILCCSEPLAALTPRHDQVLAAGPVQGSA